MGRTSELRREFKKVFVPLATAKGFRFSEKRGPTFWEFRRVATDGVHVFEIQWEKYGRPRFRVCFGKCPPEGLVVSGKLIPPGEVLSSWLPEFGTLQPRRGMSPANWFRQDKRLLRRLLSASKLRAASEVVGELTRLFAEIEVYWSEGKVGPHLRVARLKR